MVTPPAGASGLVLLRARAGEEVRWQDRPGGRWHSGTLRHREADGSVAVVDGDGRARSLVVERLHVRATGARGGRRWEPLAVRAARAEQLRLWGAP